MLGSLRCDGFRWLWLGSMATQAGLRIQDVALGWLVLDLTDSSFYLGLMSFAQSCPLLLSPLAGLLADKWDRRLILIVTQVAAALLVGVMATVVQMGFVTIKQLLAMVFLSGLVFALYFTTRQAAIPTLVGVHHLLNAYSLDYAAAHVMRVVGPSVAGILVGVIGPQGCFYLQSLGYITAGLLFSRIEPDRSRRSRGCNNVFSQLSEQWQYVIRDDTIFNLMVLAAVIVPFGMSYVVLMPVFARDVLGVGPSGLGMLLGAAGLGAIGMTLRLATADGFRHRGAKLLAATTVFGLALILFSLSRTFVISLMLLVIVGASSAVFQTMNSVLLQDMTPDDLRGRVASSYVLVWGLVPFGSLWMGAVADLWGAPLVLAVGGSICVVSTVFWAIARPSFRYLD